MSNRTIIHLNINEIIIYKLLYLKNESQFIPLATLVLKELYYHDLVSQLHLFTIKM